MCLVFEGPKTHVFVGEKNEKKIGFPVIPFEKAMPGNYDAGTVTPSKVAVPHIRGIADSSDIKHLTIE